MDSLHGNARRIRRFLNRCAQDEHTDTGEATRLLERVEGDLLHIAGHDPEHVHDHAAWLWLECFRCYGMEPLCEGCGGKGRYLVPVTVIDGALGLMVTLADRGCEDDSSAGKADPGCDCPGCAALALQREWADCQGGREGDDRGRG